MKRLILFRHAKSSWDERGQSDHERPLAPRGRHDAPMMARRLADHGLAPDLILTSSAIRARETGDLVAAAFGSPGPDRKIEPKLYLASPGEILAVLAGMKDSAGDILLIAHNPGLTQLSNMLLPDLGLLNLPTAGVVAIDCEIDSWSRIDAARFSLQLLDYPKKADPLR